MVPVVVPTISERMAGLTPVLLGGFTDIITGCINLAVGLVPIALGYLGVLMIIKKGKSLFKTTA